MSNTWLPLSLCTIRKPSAHPPGSLLALPYRSQKVAKICWALRFDASDGQQDIPHVYFIDGAPVNQPVGTVMQCRDGGLDDVDVPGLSSPKAEIGIEIDAETWVRGREVGYYDVGPFVAIGSFGYRLCGYSRTRAELPNHWIDCQKWLTDSSSFQEATNSSDAVSAYAKAWRVNVNLPSIKKAFSIDFKAQEIQP